MKKFLALIGFLCAGYVGAQAWVPIPSAWVRIDNGTLVGLTSIYDEGVLISSTLPGLNFIGASVTCVANIGTQTVDCTFTGGGGGAPTTSTYITQTPDAGLSAEQAMSLLGTGLVSNTTATGVLSIYAGATCTNQFVRVLSAAGAATCASIVNTDIAASTIDLTTKVTGLLPFANIANGSALTLFGRSANSAGVMAGIAASAASDCVFRESASTLACGTVATAGHAANSVTNAKLAQMPTLTIKGNVTAGTADPTDIPATSITALLAAWHQQNTFLFDDFYGGRNSSITGTNADLNGWAVTNTGTCTGCGNVGNVAGGLDGNHQGALNLESGTGAAPVSVVLTRGLTSGTFYFSGGEDLTMWIRIPIVSTATEAFTYVAGFGESTDLATASVDGIWFSYTDVGTGATWQMNTSSNSVATTADCTIVMTAATWHKLNIHVTSSASVSFAVDGVTCTNSPLTTNIPSTAARTTGLIMGFRKTVGTANRQIAIDAMQYMNSGIVR